MPCEWQNVRVGWIRDDMDLVLSAPDEFSQSQLIDLINYWNYALSHILIHEYEAQYHNKQFFKQLKANKKETKS